MATIVLVSSRIELQNEISALLPENWTLSNYKSVADAQSHPEYSSQAPHEDYIILLDVTDQPDWTGRLSGSNSWRGRVIAIINDIGQRDVVLQSGADDYLLRPLLASEIKICLERARHASEMIRRLLMQLSQRDHQASVGRLTSHICHEINNAMQATRGALALALEEPKVPMELTSYITLCQNETQRVVSLVGRMRQIYHPDNREPEPISVDSLVREVVKAASEELDRNNMRLVEDFAVDLPPVRGIRDQLYLAFLSMVLNLSEVVEAAEEREMHVSLQLVEGSLQLRIWTDLALLRIEDSSGRVYPDEDITLTEALLGLSPAAEIIRSHRGWIEIQRDKRELSIQVTLPVL